MYVAHASPGPARCLFVFNPFEFHPSPSNVPLLAPVVPVRAVTAPLGTQADGCGPCGFALVQDSGCACTQLLARPICPYNHAVIHACACGSPLSRPFSLSLLLSVVLFYTDFQLIDIWLFGWVLKRKRELGKKNCQAEKWKQITWCTLFLTPK